MNGTATIDTLQLTNALAILYGGTGATTAAGALANLGTDAALSVGGATITLAKITPGGSNGSITINSAGRVTAWVQPT